MKRAAQFLFSIVCVFGLSALPVWADGVSRDGIGAIPIGRGGTNTSMSDNGAILLDNPAGMGNISGNGLFEFAADGLFLDLHYSDPLNFRTPNHHNPLALPYLSYMQRIADTGWTVGMGVFAPAGFGAQWDINNPFLGPQQTYKSFGALLKVLPGVAYNVTDNLSIGGTVGVAISTIQFEGPFVGQLPPLRGIPSFLDLHGTGVTPCWSIGMQYKLGDRTTLGLAYQSESRFTLHGNASVGVAGLVPGALVGTQYSTRTDLNWPRSLSGGINHVFGEERRHRVSADIIWFDWSDAFDHVGLDLLRSTNPLFTALLGPQVHDEFPLRWRDSISTRLGYEFALTPRDILRCGYIYHPQPVPSQTLTPYIPAILEHAFSVGYSRQLHSWDFNIAYQYSFGVDRSVTRSGLIGSNFDFSTLEANVHWLSFSFTYRF
jgi:long-subunit fatty acid transport protein